MQLTFTDEKKAFAISAFKVNMINDRETFMGLDDTDAGFKNIASDLGIDLENGGLAHKREMSRLITAWNKLALLRNRNYKSTPRPKLTEYPRLYYQKIGRP